MDPDEFEAFYAQAARIARFLAQSFRDLTGEELELEAAVRHYPLTSLAAAAGLGAFGGWLVARRSSPGRQKRLPFSWGQDDGWETNRSQNPSQEPGPKMPYLEQLFPEGMEKMRETLYRLRAEEASEAASAWLEQVFGPKFKERLDKAVSNFPDSPLAAYLRRRLL